mgnify:CR=1 FL=1
MPKRATKEENLASYTVFGGVAIQNRIAASFFSSDLISKKFRSEEKKGDIS